MKSNIAVKYMIILSFILSSSIAIAEESGDMYLGISAGSGKSYHESDEASFMNFQNNYTAFDYHMPIFLEISNDYTLGLNFEYVLFKNDDWSNAINIFTAYRNSELVFEAGGIQYGTTFYENNDSITTFSIVHNDFEMQIQNLDIDALYKIKFNTFVQFGIALGPFITIPLKTEAKEVYRIGRTYQINENSDTLELEILSNRTITNDKSFNENFLNWGAKANLFLEYEIIDKIKIMAGYNLTLPLSNFTKDYDWKIRYTYYTFGISYKLN